jgi:hypothetical protein
MMGMWREVTLAVLMLSNENKICLVRLRKIMKFAKQSSRSPRTFSKAKQEIYCLSCGVLVTDVSLLFVHVLYT